MTNAILKNAMVDKYDSYAYTDQYIFGFTFAGNVYMVVADSKAMRETTSISKASRGNGYALRFRPTVEQKMYLMSLGATVLCSEKFFKETVASSKYNKGDIYERMVANHFGIDWVKNSDPFWKAGDVTIDNIAYQIKFQGATYTNEKFLSRL